VSASEPTIWQAPDLVAPILGFRQWRLREGALWSPFSHVRWGDAELRACCSTGVHEDLAPVKQCTCGIYAYYTPCPRMASTGTVEFVSGAVAVWGHIELHATGLRASHARIVALERPPLGAIKRRRLLEAAESLGVPVVRHRNLPTVASEHGSILPRSLRPPVEWATADRRPYLGVVPRTCLALLHTARLSRSSAPADPSTTSESELGR